MAKAKPNGRCFCSYERTDSKVEELFQDFDIPSVVSNWDQLLDGHVQIVQGHYKQGLNCLKQARGDYGKEIFHTTTKNGHVVKQSLMRNV